MRRRPAITLLLMLLAAGLLHAVSVARQSSDAASQRLTGGEDYICTACGPIPKGGACPVAPAKPPSTVDQP
jgi:hypothetical protein